MSKDDIQKIFTGLSLKLEDDITVNNRGGYFAKFKDLHDGYYHSFVFDKNGRLIRISHTDTSFQSETYIYDEDGYLIKRSLCHLSLTTQDEFTYSISADGKKIPATMIRTYNDEHFKFCHNLFTLEFILNNPAVA